MRTISYEIAMLWCAKLSRSNHLLKKEIYEKKKKKNILMI